MAKAVLHADDNGVTASLVFKDRKGNVTTPQDKPRWSVSADGIVSMTVSEDGLSASFAPAAVGSVTVDAVVDADPTEGVREIHATGEIEVVAAEAATAEMQFVTTV